MSIRVGTLLCVFLPFVGFVVAAVHLWGWGFNGLYLGLLCGMYIATGLGVTLGYHRLFTHRAFETFPAIKVLFSVLGAMSVEGPLVRWVATHRKHHQHSDEAQDPHSPHCYGGGFWGVVRGCWFAHCGWMFKPEIEGLDRYVGDLHRDKLTCRVSGLFALWVVLGLAIPTAIGGLVTGTWVGAALGFLWGGPARIFLVHHATFSINSICHLWGEKTFDCNDESRNNLVFGIFGLGEGWHNNHHAFPSSARHGLTWWQFDITYIAIRLLSFVGLAWRVQVPSKDTIANKRTFDPSA
ncbi:MAG: fatty acid desaturase, partial [Planctomycetes bacterium]|nr:fatty acid desaturase [Planctomycetota bacterium]